MQDKCSKMLIFAEVVCKERFHVSMHSRDIVSANSRYSHFNYAFDAFQFDPEVG